MAADCPVHRHPPDRQRDLWEITVRPRTGGFVGSTDASKDIQGPILEEETAWGGSFCRGTEHCSDPIARYVTVVIFDS